VKQNTGCVSESGDFVTLVFFWFGNTAADAAIAILLPTVTIVTSGTYLSHLQIVFASPLGFPLFHHATIYLDVSLLRENSQNEFSRETTECSAALVTCCCDVL
jgi:hypothetical protein